MSELSFGIFISLVFVLSGHAQEIGPSMTQAAATKTEADAVGITEEVSKQKLDELLKGKRAIVITGSGELPDVLLLIPSGYSLNRSRDATALKGRFENLISFLAGENSSGFFVMDDCFSNKKVEDGEPDDKPANEPKNAGIEKD